MGEYLMMHNNTQKVSTESLYILQILILINTYKYLM